MIRVSFEKVVVRVGLGMNRTTNASSAVLNSSSSSSSPTLSAQPMVAHVEPRQTEASQAAKTLEQRRMEAREILMKERHRQLTSPSRLTARKY